MFLGRDDSACFFIGVIFESEEYTKFSRLDFVIFSPVKIRCVVFVAGLIHIYFACPCSINCKDLESLYSNEYGLSPF
jgi:hypothetical protein